MADNADDKPQRNAADKERSRQMSRAVSGKEAARGTGGGGNRRSGQQPAGSRGPGRAGGNQRQSQPGRNGQTRSQPASRQTKNRQAGGRNARPARRPPARSGPARSGPARSTLVIWGSIALVIVIVVVLVVVNRSTTPKATVYTPEPVPAKVLSEITHVPTSVFNKVGTGIAGTIHPPTVKTGQPALTFTGKPGVFGMFGEFCPYCAAERWSIITAFSRFGSFSGLKTMQSSPTDVDPKTQTFTFHTAKYVSSYFVAKLLEYYGQDQPTGKRPIIGKPTKQEINLVDKYDHPTGTTSSTGSIPFMDFGNKVISEGVSYTPQPLQGLSRTTIAAGLSNPNSTITKLIIGSSNYLSASICNMDGAKPASVCSSSGVQAAAKALKLSF